MKLYQKSVLTLATGAAFALAAFAAQAAAITNLTDQPQTVEVAIGQDFSPVTIPAGQTWRSITKIVVRYHGNEVHMENNQEFAIWPGGDFGPQRTFSSHGGYTFP